MIASALFIAASQSANAYPAKLGQPYLIGYVGRMPETNEALEMGLQRIVTLQSVETALAFGFKSRTFVASEGHKLVIFHATIQNPEKRPILVSDSNCFGLRVYETKFNGKDVRYLGCGSKSLEDLHLQLKPKASIDVISVYEFPEVTPHLKIGLDFSAHKSPKAPKFDLTSAIKSPSSVFAESNMKYGSTAKVKVGEPFDLDDLNFKVLGIVDTKEGPEVRVQVSSKMPFPGRWGWQYGKATMNMSDGKIVDYYPDFIIEPEFATWNHELKQGQSVIGRYRFNPPSGSMVSFELKSIATKRKVVVTL